MTSPLADQLTRLASEFGIDTGYWDIWGRRHENSPEALAAILKAHGLDCSSPERLAESAERRKLQELNRPLDPVRVLCVSEPDPSVELRLPAESGGQGTMALAVYWEDRQAERHDIGLAGLQKLGEAEASCRRFLRLKLPLPCPLRLGYHDLEVAIRPQDGPEIRAGARLIVAPDSAWLPERLQRGGRIAGLAVSLYGLRSKRNWGVGDFTDLARLAQWVALKLGAGLVALNPLHALHNRQPYNTSPYLPLSSYYRNFIYLDIEALEDFRLSGSARALVASPGFQAQAAALRASEFVEYERVARLKRVVLKQLFRRFLREEWRPETPRAREFRKWIAAEGDLLDRFAIYCALDEYLHLKDRNLWIWPDWPEQYRDPSSPAVAEFARSEWRRVLFFKYVQWQIDVQLRGVQARVRALGMPVGLYHDLALATDRCGADLWEYHEFFVKGCRVGAPPDDFAPDGQDWSFPPPDWLAHREDGYRLFIETIRKNARHGGALRIDHVMRFFRLFWIPEGMTAKEGTYVNERWEELLHILALESVRGQFLVIGEDLGTVPDGMREALERHGMLGYRLFYFQKSGNGLPTPPADYPRQVLVSSTTHDLPTLAGFWAGRDIEARRAAGILKDDAQFERHKNERREDKRKLLEALIRAGFLPADFPRDAADWQELTGELHNAVIGYLVSTPSMLMLLNEEDLTKELDQQNLPGTTWEYPNWRRKMSFSIEDLHELPLAADFAQMFHKWLDQTGRLTRSQG